MADFEIIEADFQQYYGLDVSKVRFRRYARLLVNLPVESRFIQKYSPLKDWNWDKEIQSQILHSVDTMIALYANAHRKKGAKRQKVPPQVQPDYVERGKKELKHGKADENKAKQAELAAIFEKKNNRAKKLERNIDGA